MPLILAIEPDRRQAAQLKTLVRSRLGADLVLAETTELALEAIGDRVPDLVLVPALLSPQDDAALAAALRVIATAAHVQTLTIPVFAAPGHRSSSGKGGMLARLRGKIEQSPEGCDPAIFAEQIAAYLSEVESKRASIDFAGMDRARSSPPPSPTSRPAARPAPKVDPSFDTFVRDEDAAPAPSSARFEAPGVRRTWPSGPRAPPETSADTGAGRGSSC